MVGRDGGRLCRVGSDDSRWRLSTLRPPLSVWLLAWRSGRVCSRPKRRRRSHIMRPATPLQVHTLATTRRMGSRRAPPDGLASHCARATPAAVVLGDAYRLVPRACRSAPQGLYHPARLGGTGLRTVPAARATALQQAAGERTDHGVEWQNLSAPRLGRLGRFSRALGRRPAAGGRAMRTAAS